jgi:hypothetical protein
LKAISLYRVKYLPKDLSEGILYVSSEYSVAGHLCACGCGTKVITPLGPAEWTFSERNELPTLRPSIGNWQLPCRSHYVITEGQIRWAGNWSDAQIIAGRQAEQQRRKAYYKSLDGKRGFWNWLLDFVRKLFGR